MRRGATPKRRRHPRLMLQDVINSVAPARRDTEMVLFVLLMQINLVHSQKFAYAQGCKWCSVSLVVPIEFFVPFWYFGFALFFIV